MEGECTPRLCFRGVIRGTGIDGELSPTAPGGSWQILNSSVSTTVAASSVCQNPCPACVRDENTLSPGLEFWLQNGFCFLPILTWGREQPYSKEKLLLSGSGGGGGGRVSDSLGESLSLRREEERKPRGYLLAYLLTRVDVATTASMRLGAPGRVLETNNKHLLLLEGCYAYSHLCTSRKL